TTATSEAYCAASATVAACVLSPISTRKNAINVVRNAPSRVAGLSMSSALSGISVQAAMTRKPQPTIQRIVPGPRAAATKCPAAPASVWFASVATTMPSTTGSGLRKRSVSVRASNWVLSPISASATTAVERSNALIRIFSGACARHDDQHAPWPECQDVMVKGLTKPGGRLRHGLVAKYVDAGTAARPRAVTPQ